MDLNKTINILENLVKSLPTDSDILNLQTYSAIKTLFREINKHVALENEGGNNIGFNNHKIYLAELNYPLQTIVGLEDNGHTIEQNLLWCDASFIKLRSKLCFNLSKE